MDIDQPDPPFLGLAVGTVTTRDDPMGLGRVRVRVPGLLEPQSAWALPIGLPGAGEKDRGTFWVPEEGAEVALFFNMGDPDQPRYMAGHWGRPNDEPDVPDASEGGNPDIRVLAFGGYDLIVDTRSDSKKLTIIDKEKGENVLRLEAGSETTTLGASKVIRLVVGSQTQTMDNDAGTVAIEASQTLTLEGGTEVRITAGTQLKIDGGTLVEVLAQALIDLGGPGSQFVAIASLVATELAKIAATLNTGTTSAGPVTFGSPYIPGNVAATRVKAL